MAIAAPLADKMAVGPIPARPAYGVITARRPTVKVYPYATTRAVSLVTGSVSSGQIRLLDLSQTDATICAQMAYTQRLWYRFCSAVWGHSFALAVGSCLHVGSGSWPCENEI